MKTNILIIFLFVCTFCHAQNKKALIIGISEYPLNKNYPSASWHKINGANDAYLIEKTLKIQGFQAQLLVDNKATAKNIRRYLNKIIHTANSGDIVYLHFSGHGQAEKDGVNGYPKDEEDGWDEAFIPYDAWKKPIGNYKGECHFTDDELQVYMNAIREKIGLKGFLYIVIDACHAGDMQKGEEDDEEENFYRGSSDAFSLDNSIYVPRIRSTSNFTKIDTAPNMSNVCIFEACRAYQINNEIKVGSLYLGPLSYYINKALISTKIDNNISTASKIISEVELSMKSDIRLRKQNLVIEKSF